MTDQASQEGAGSGSIEPDAEGGDQPRREPVFNLPAVVVVFIALCVAIHAVRVYVLTVPQDLELLVRTAFIPIRYSGQFPIDFYDFTSPVTYSLMHGGIAHLAINMIWLAAFGSPLANRIGWQRFLLFWAATSVAAALYAAFFGPRAAGGRLRCDFRDDGCGGTIRFPDRPVGRPGGFPRRRPAGRAGAEVGVLTFLAVWMVVNLVTGLIGFTPGSDDQIAWEAHISGFFAGFLGISAFDRRPAE